MAQRIDQGFVNEFNKRFTKQIAMDFREKHHMNCHHWDYTFLLWHRKLVKEFWARIGLLWTYAVLTEEKDRALYSSLKKTVVEENGEYRFKTDGKSAKFESRDISSMKKYIRAAMGRDWFASDIGEPLHQGMAPRTRPSLPPLEADIAFSDYVEEFHDEVHVATGGSMRFIETAGGDQRFFIHHTFVDLVFETWLMKNKGIKMPISKKLFDDEGLKGDYGSYENLHTLWNARYFEEADYKIVENIVDDADLSDGEGHVVFDRIKHTESHRHVIMRHQNEEIGRFAIFTGTPDTCQKCATRGEHRGIFLLDKLVPVEEISWEINKDGNQLEWNDAVKRFGEIGMSEPEVFSKDDQQD